MPTIMAPSISQEVPPKRGVGVGGEGVRYGLRPCGPPPRRYRSIAEQACIVRYEAHRGKLRIPVDAFLDAEALTSVVPGTPPQRLP